MFLFIKKCQKVGKSGAKWDTLSHKCLFLYSNKTYDLYTLLVILIIFHSSTSFSPYIEHFFIHPLLLVLLAFGYPPIHGSRYRTHHLDSLDRALHLLLMLLLRIP